MTYEDFDALFLSRRPVDLSGNSLLFTFTYRRRCYAVVDVTKGGEEGAVVCRPLRFSPAAGSWVDAGRVAPHEADVMMYRLLRRAQAAPGKYELEGEHYRVTDGGKPGSCRVRVCLPRTVGVSDRRSAAIRFCFFVMMAVIYQWLYVWQTDMKWVRAAFPAIPKYPLTVLFVCTSLFLSVGLYLLFRNDRSFYDAVMLIICPPNVFSVIGAAIRIPAVRLILPALFAVTFLFFALPFPLLGDRSALHPDKEDVVTALRLAAAMSILLTSVLLPLSDSLGFVPQQPYSEAESREISEAQAEFSALSERLRDGNWDKLTTDEKLEALQAVVDYEAIVTLGVQPPTVVARDILRSNVEGTYSHADDRITVDRSVLARESSERAVNTVLHEVRHAWQHAMADLYEQVKEIADKDVVRLSVMRDAHDYGYEFDHYQTSETGGFDAYYHQKVEEDSRVFADERIRDLYRYLIMPLMK